MLMPFHSVNRQRCVFCVDFGVVFSARRLFHKLQTNARHKQVHIQHSNEIFIFRSCLRHRARTRRSSCRSLFRVAFVWNGESDVFRMHLTTATHCSGILFANISRQCSGRYLSASSSFYQRTENTIEYFFWQVNAWVKRFMYVHMCSWHKSLLGLEQRIYILWILCRVGLTCALWISYRLKASSRSHVRDDGANVFFSSCIMHRNVSFTLKWTTWAVHIVLSLLKGHEHWLE